ncbi:MAG: hypothetical protein IJA69_04425, partial [Clostridia bacterium]|nr:hypothetical protein [Clostridia bacterium]
KWKTADGKETYAAYMLWGTELPTTFTPMSGIVFRATSYNANRIRRDESFYNKYINPNADSGFETNANGETTNFNIFNQANSADEAASMVDEAFQLGMKVKTPAKLKDIGDPIEGINEGLFSEYGNITKFDRFNVGLVSYYYSLWHMDFLVAIIFVYFLIKLFLEVTLGLMQRLVEVVALLMFLPVVCAFMPVDNGEGFKKWRAHFITKTISGYVVIVSINIFFIIYPLFNAIQFFGPGWDVVNYMLTSIFLIAGMLSVKTVNSMFATMFTIDKINANVMDAGKNALTEGTSMIKQGAGTGLKIAKFATFPAALAAKHGFAALGKKIGDSGRTKHLNKGLDAGVSAANPGLTGTALEAAQQQERTDYGRYQQSGEEDYINETIADTVRAEGVARGDSEATIRANILAEQQAYRADPNIRDSSGNVKYAELNRQMTRFKAADSRMKTYDQKQQKKKEEQKGAKAVKGVTGTLLSLLTGGLVELPDDKKKK